MLKNKFLDKNYNKNKIIKKIIYLILTFLLVLTSYLFQFTKGLVYDIDNAGNIYFTNDLKSSGSNDNICIEIGIILFLIPFFFKLFRIRKDIKLYDIIAFTVIWVVQLFFLISIETGSIIKTIFINNNIILLLWLFILIVSILFIKIFVLLPFVKNLLNKQ